MAALKELDMDVEFAGLDFRSLCLERRFVRTMKTLMNQPGKSIWEASEDRAEAKAIYRMLANRKFSREEILGRHREAVMRRMVEHGGTILAVQDTVGLNYSTHWKTKGIGYIGGDTLGVSIRTCLAVTGDGMILGLLDQSSCSGQHPDEPADETNETEISRWFKTLERSKAGIPDGIKVIALCDGEGDVYERFAKAASQGNALLMRVTEDGMTGESGRILEELRNKPSQGQIMIVIPGDSRGSPERKALFQLWYAPFAINNPHTPDPAQTLPNSVTVNAIYVKETQPPAGKEPVEWFLLTSEEVSSPQEARKYTAYYTRRQLTERFHHVLKNGCAIERLQERSVEKTAILVLMYSIISVMLLNRP
ncbi:MAG: IS4 family transposase [Spirochaetaceae bacterium]|jgi:hypothetical protein|nr:IS4 family transposase [Spirochaetaceae bacterium]